MQKINCSVGILTFNSARTLGRTLESVKDFEDIVICDGGSTDETLSIAQAYGARVIGQDARFKNPDGSLRDFSGVRNQTLEAARHQWFFFIDSDEYADEALCDEVRSVIASGAVGAYWVPRLYTLRGDVIHCASTYPNRQMRFFHRSIALKFIKEVHERIDLKPGVVPQKLTSPLYVPLPDTAQVLVARWKRYLAIEVARRTEVSLGSWFAIALHQSGIAGLFILRAVRNLLFCRGLSMPLSFEVARVWYQFAFIAALASKITLRKTHESRP